MTFGTKTGTAVMYQQDDYLPFGLEITRNVISPKNEYLYNKKELQEELTEYDYGARFYDPVIARWNTVDAMAEIDRRWSPYNYVENNPIRLTDPDGDSVKYDAAGNMTATGADAVNVGWGLKIAGEATHQGKDKDRADAKESSDQKDKKEANNSNNSNKTIHILIEDTGNSIRDVGHTAIQIDNLVYGFYPTDENGNGAYDKSELKSSKGDLEEYGRDVFNDTYNATGYTDFSVSVSTAQIEALKVYYTEKKKNPGTYSLFGDQCTSIAIMALKSAGINLTTPSKYGPLPIHAKLMSPADLKAVLEHSNKVQLHTHYRY